MIIHTHQKSKKRKLNAKQRELRDSWNELVQKYAPKKPLKVVKVTASPVVSKPYVRETPHYPSLDSWEGTATKPIHGKVYTGTAMKGIGTLHKSNAVPIFTDEEARDQAAMRR
ncbi:MAG: hypothetical protein EBR30_03315 [Cytophagia bacterium]|jgi:uncharacterized protein (DUF2147 family)|nr:hypothetical protein [Cytophagia bacterium]